MHAIVFSPDTVKLRAFLADVLNLPSADARRLAHLRAAARRAGRSSC
jgi:hypothetical protein